MNAVRMFGLTLVAVMVCATSSMAKDMKIAYVDLSRLFDNYTKTKEYDGVLQKEGDVFQKQRDEMINKIRDAQGKLALMKEDEKQKLGADIEKQKNDLIEFDKQKRTELAKRRDDKVREILLEINKIVSDLAQKQGYDFVLNDRVLVYGDKTQDITETVLKSLNDSYKK